MPQASHNPPFQVACHLKTWKLCSPTAYMLKFSMGAGVVTPSKPPLPYNNFFLYPPLFIMFLKNPVMTPHLPTSSIFHCYHSLPLPPLKSLIIHFHVHCSKVFTKIFSKILSVGSSCRYHCFLFGLCNVVASRRLRYYAATAQTLYMVQNIFFLLQDICAAAFVAHFNPSHAKG